MATLPAGVLVQFTKATQIGGHEMSIHDNGSVHVQDHRQSGKKSQEISKEKLEEVKIDISNVLKLQEGRYSIWTPVSYSPSFSITISDDDVVKRFEIRGWPTRNQPNKLDNGESMPEAITELLNVLHEIFMSIK